MQVEKVLSDIIVHDVRYASKTRQELRPQQMQTHSIATSSLFRLEPTSLTVAKGLIVSFSFTMFHRPCQTRILRPLLPLIDAEDLTTIAQHIAHRLVLLPVAFLTLV